MQVFHEMHITVCWWSKDVLWSWNPWARHSHHKVRQWTLYWASSMKLLSSQHNFRPALGTT